MDVEAILEQMMSLYGERITASGTIQSIQKKLTESLATYADAQGGAIEIGDILTDIFREYLPEALTDGRLLQETAEVLIRQPMVQAGEDVARITTAIQESLNEDAGLGIEAIVPEMNEDQLNGIISGISDVEYDRYSGSFLDRIGNYLEGYVDDFVHENAEFQYQAGLEPTIERFAVGKCCAWCDNLQGTYEYSKVRNKGNDVFRRHRNCHCQVLYNPGNGSKKRQNVHTRQWTEETDTDTIEQRSNQLEETVRRRLYASELRNGLPITSSPNSISDKLDDEGNVVQRRIYGATGRAEIDYDLTDHGETWKYPTGAHKHIFEYTGPKIQRKNAVMTEEDLKKNSDIIIRGVNYFDQ